MFDFDVVTGPTPEIPRPGKPESKEPPRDQPERESGSVKSKRIGTSTTA